MVPRQDASKCGTVQGAFAQAPAAKALIFADIADALLPIVAAIVAPRVERNLMGAANPPVMRRTKRRRRDIGDDSDPSPEEEAIIRALGAPLILDPAERKKIAADVAADDARRLAGVWLRGLGLLVGAGGLRVLPALHERRSPRVLLPADFRGFDALTVDEANRILCGIGDAPNAETIFDLVNAYLAL